LVGANFLGHFGEETNPEIVRQQQEAKLKRQQGLGDLQLQQQQTQQQQQQLQTQAKPTYSRSQEGIPEHLYELTQDYTIHLGEILIRLRRGERYHGRILVDHD
jgi:hypothetical protein